MSSGLTANERFRRAGTRAMFWIVCFLAPIIMLAVIAAASNVYPFGTQSFLTEDLKYQYVDFYAWFKRVLTGDASILYSASQGLGSNTWGLYSYYLASPLNLLVVFFDRAHVTDFAMIAAALRLGLMGVSCALWLRRRYSLPPAWTFCLALCFCWCSWSACQLRNPMWMDAIVLLPLLALSVHRLVCKSRWFPFSLCIAASIMVCWYMGYMLVLFSLVLIAYEFFGTTRAETSGQEPHSLRRLILLLLKAYAFALVLSAWTFVPTVLAMLSASGNSDSMLQALTSNSGILNTGITNIVYGILPGMWRDYAVPQLHGGIIVLVLCLMFLCSRTIPARRKVTAAACVIFLFASIVVIPLEYIWCGFRQPNGFYSRIAIFAWFFLLIIAAERVAAGWHGKARIAPVIPWAICLITCFELSYSAITIWKQLYVGYEESFHERYVTEADAQLAYLTEYDTGAWRFERTYQRAWPASLNEGAASGFKQLSSYSSANNPSAISLLNALGYSNPGEFSTRYAGPILPSDSLLGVRYLSAPEQPAGYTALIGAPQCIGNGVYTNEHALPLAYLVSRDAMNFSLEATGGADNPFDVQNAFASALLGYDVELFKAIEPATTQRADDDTSVAFEVSVPTGCLGYVYVPSSLPERVGLAIDGASAIQQNWRFQHSAIAFDTIEGESGGMHTVRLEAPPDTTLPDSASCLFYYLDIAAYEDAMTALEAGSMDITAFEDGYIAGNIATGATEESSLLLATVPCENGWEVRVNGKRVEPIAIADGALTGIPIGPGENQIEMRFLPPGLIIGCAITAAGILGTAAYAIRQRARRRKQPIGAHAS